MVSNKDVAAILYMYYINNYLENDFCYDNGDLRGKVKSHYKNLAISEDELEEIESNIDVYENEGSDSDWLEIVYTEMDEVVLQVNAVIDYDNKPVEGYTGTDKYADTGVFYLDDCPVEFDDL